MSFGPGVVRSVPAYWRHRREFPKSNLVFRAGVTTWTMKRAVEKLERVTQRPITQNQPEYCEFEEEYM